MERYVFSRAADYISINYAVKSLKLQRAVIFLYHPRKIVESFSSQLVIGTKISIFYSVHQFLPSQTVGLIEIGWCHHPYTKELWKLF